MKPAKKTKWPEGQQPRKRQLLQLFAVLFSFALIISACGGSDDSSDDGASGQVETSDSDNDSSGDSSSDSSADSDDGADEPEDDVIEAGAEAEGDVDTEVVEAEEVGKYGGTVVVGMESEATGLRPPEDACSSPCRNMTYAIFDPLMMTRSDGTIGPWLATSATPNEDFTRWELELREGVVFHNGVGFDANVLKDIFAIQLTGAQTTGILNSGGVVMDETGLEVLGDYKVAYNLVRSNSAFPAVLATGSRLSVFEPGAYLEMAEEFSISPVGTGAFQIESRDLDNETILVRNDNYWLSDEEGNQLPYLDSMVFRPIPDEGTRLDSLLSGTTDVLHTLRQGTIRDGRDASSSGDYTLYEFQGNNVGGGMFNNAVPPYDDVRVRRGLTQMNNQDAVIDALGGTGISLPGSQWFSPDSVWYSEKAAAAWPQFDFAAGQATLQEYVDDSERSDGKAAGEPIEVELSCPPDPTLIAAMQVLEQLWTQSGLVEVNLTNYDQQTHINYALGGPDGDDADDPADDWRGSHGAHCWRWSSDDDPSTEINRQFVPYNSANAVDNGLPPELISPQNFANYFDADVLAAMTAAIETDVFEERYALYEEIMLNFAENVPVWYSGHTATMLMTDGDIFGLNTWELPDGTLGRGHPNAEGRWSHVWRDAS